MFDICQVNSSSKRSAFLGGLSCHLKTKRLNKLKKFINKKFTAQDWQKAFGLKSYISAHKFLGSLVEEDILLFYFRQNKKYYYINSKKIDFLELVWAIACQ